MTPAGSRPATAEGPEVHLGPLGGVRVLDLSGRTGAYCTKILADLGADVIKVELPAGDRLRFVPPFRDGQTGPEAGLLFAYYHHNKRGITLDWRRAESWELLESLAASSDVVVASPKGEPERPIGFVEESPSLTWVSGSVLTCFITPFGLTGPYRDWRATPLTSFAMSGYMHAFGPPEGPPVSMPGQPFYDEAGMWAAFLVQATLRAPRSTWAQVLDLSVHEVGLFNKLGTEQYGLAGQIKSRATNFGPPPGGIWRCSDGLVDIGAHSDRQWAIFVDLLGAPDVLSDPMYRDRVMRIQLFDLLTGLIAEHMATWRAREFVAVAQAAGLPCALSQTPAEFTRDPQPAARGYFVASERAGTASFSMPGLPFLSDRALLSYRRSAPGLGESNTEIYVQELGRSMDELQKWQADGLV
jgi:crotonobetainyl-CoA:carnitine CoA-transferase CaiB-like acyl-CoA transferase